MIEIDASLILLTLPSSLLCEALNVEVPNPNKSEHNVASGQLLVKKRKAQSACLNLKVRMALQEH